MGFIKDYLARVGTLLGKPAGTSNSNLAHFWAHDRDGVQSFVNTSPKAKTIIYGVLVELNAGDHPFQDGSEIDNSFRNLLASIKQISSSLSNTTFNLYHVKFPVEDAADIAKDNSFLSELQEASEGLRQQMFQRKAVIEMLVEYPMAKLNESKAEFKQILNALLTGAKDMNPKVLSLRKETDTYGKTRLYSEVFEFHSLVQQGYIPGYKVPYNPAHMLGYEMIKTPDFLQFEPSGTVIKSSDLGSAVPDEYEHTFYRHIYICDLPDDIQPELLADLYNRCPFTFVIKTSMRAIRADVAARAVNDQHVLASMNDESVSRKMGSAMEDTIEALKNNELEVSRMSVNVRVFGDSAEAVQANTADMLRNLDSAGFVGRIATPSNFNLTDVASRANDAFFPTLEQRSPYIFNVINSNAFLSLCPPFIPVAGKRHGNCWGDAIFSVRDIHSHQYFLNFHKEEPGQSFLSRLPGHAFVIGQTGSGKTAFLNYALTHMTKFSKPESFVHQGNKEIGKQEMKIVILDKDNGCFPTVMANNGKYVDIQAGVNSGFNLASLFKHSHDSADLDEGEFDFKEKVLELLVRMVEQTRKDKISSGERQYLRQTINEYIKLIKQDSVHKTSRDYRYPISKILTFIQSGKEYSRLKEDLLLWSSNFGQRPQNFSWVFDSGNEVDILDQDAMMLGIEGGQLLNHPGISSIVIQYIFTKITSWLDGRRVVLSIDECWSWLTDEATQMHVKNALKVWRKLNGMVILATQTLEDLVKSPVAADILAQCVTKVIFTGKYRVEDGELLGLTGPQFDEVQKLGSYKALLIKGNTPYSAAQIDFNFQSRAPAGYGERLVGLPRFYVNILSATRETVDLLKAYFKHNGLAPYHMWKHALADEIYARTNSDPFSPI